jgi:phosphate transport system substrate-binding protein
MKIVKKEALFVRKKIMSILVLIIIFIFSACAKAGTAQSVDITGTVTSSGSTALLPIVKQAAQEFMNINKKLTVTVGGGGSGTGLQQVKNGTVNIGNSDVFDESGSGLFDNQVAIEPFAFIVNRNVKITNLTKEQLSGIFSGEITNWSVLGGDNAKITVVMQQPSSGTRMTIQKQVMGNKTFATNAIVIESSGAVKKTVASTPYSIGYVDFAYVDTSLKALSYDGIAPTIENVKNGKYTLKSIGHMYTKGAPKGAVKGFIKYIQSADFQNKILPKYQFVPILK